MMKKFKCRVVAKPQQKGKEMDKLCIVCKSEKEESKVLEELEKQGKKWSDGEKPTESNYFSNYDREYAIIVDGSVIYYTANATMSITSIPYYKNAKKISAAEFLKKNKETIVIYRNGAETIALEKNTGRKAVAKCHTDDTYNFEIGAKLALTRLFPEPVREVSRYAEVGEYIKITDPIAAMGTYKKGDIFRVKEAFPPIKDTVQCVKCYGVNIIVRYDEYVVLENYQPEDKPEQYYNGKVVCIHVSSVYKGLLTKGKIYEIVDGEYTFDNGVKSKLKWRTIEDINENLESKFIELVE